MSINSNETRLVNSTITELTTNIKIVVEDETKYFLNSLPQNSTLSRSEFQKIPLYDGVPWGISLSKFWRDKNITSDTIYKTSNTNLNLAGCSVNDNFRYVHQFKYFAPLWSSSNNSPDYFIIFKLDDFDNTESITDWPEFYKTKLYTSPIFKKFSLKEGRFGDFFNSLTPSSVTYENSTDEKAIKLNGILISSGMNYSMDYALLNMFDVTDQQVIQIFSSNGLASNKLYNFEFLFSDDLNLESDSTIYFGAYFTKEEICRMNIDIDKHNLTLENKINDIYANIGEPKLEINQEDGVDIHIKDFDVDLSRLFYYDCFTSGNDYGFYYNPYCQEDYGTEITYGADGGYYDTIVPDSTFLDWVDSYGYDIDYWLYCDYDYDYLENGNGAFFYAIQDRKGQVFNIKEFGQTLKLSNTKLFLDAFYGTDPTESLSIPGKILNTESYNHLKLEIRKTDRNPIFNNGDWIQVRAGYATENFVWRVIFDNGSCCNSGDVCYYNAPKIKDRSCDLTFERQHNSIFLTMKFNRRHNFQEGMPIILNCEKFRNIPFYISKVIYNFEDDTTSILIVDFLGKYFRTCNAVRYMDFEYEGPSYHYAFVNPNGTIRDISQKISEAFNRFPNKLFEAIEYDDTIILKSKEPGYLFGNFYFDYDFTKTSTPTSNLIINNQSASGTPIFDSHLFEFYRRNRYSGIQFFGGSEFNSGVRFYVNREWLLENMDGTELIPTEFTKSPIQKYDVERVNTFYSNYLDEPIYSNQVLEGFINLNENAVINLEKSNNKIRVSSRGVIDATYPYKPKLLKFLIYKQEDI